MGFVRDSADATQVHDNFFKIATMAAKRKAEAGADKVFNATLGSLFDEEGNLVTLDTVYRVYDSIPDRAKAAYAPAITGDPEYCEEVLKWIVRDHCPKLAKRCCATVGGTGACSLTVNLVLEAGQSLLAPNLAWDAYFLMAEQYNLEVERYTLFEGDHFNITSFTEKAEKIMAKQGRLLAIINDPCHNPCGYSMSVPEWQAVVSVLNRLSEQGPVVLLDDIAYIDYAKDPDAARNYLECFNELAENVAVVLAFSCSKMMTGYGQRTGAAIIMSKNKQGVDDLYFSAERFGRSVWSNVNHGFMKALVKLLREHKEEYLAEKRKYIDLLSARAEVFVNEAKECGLPCYPYRDGFFVTLSIEDEDLVDRYHEALMEHDIFTCEVNRRIRVAVCSISLKNVRGLAYKMKKVLDEMEQK